MHPQDTSTDHLTVRLCKYLMAAPRTLSHLCDVFNMKRGRLRSAIGNLVQQRCIQAVGERVNREAAYQFLAMPNAATRPKQISGVRDYDKRIRVAAKKKYVGEIVRPATFEFKPLKRDPFEQWRLRECPETSTAAVFTLKR